MKNERNNIFTGNSEAMEEEMLRTKEFSSWAKILQGGRHIRAIQGLPPNSDLVIDTPISETAIVGASKKALVCGRLRTCILLIYGVCMDEI